MRCRRACLSGERGGEWGCRLRGVDRRMGLLSGGGELMMVGSHLISSVCSSFRLVVDRLGLFLGEEAQKYSYLTAFGVILVVPVHSLRFYLAISLSYPPVFHM